MIIEKASAKLNLNLHLLPKKLDNNFYPVRFINCQIDLSDDLSFQKIKNKIVLITDDKELPLGMDNLIYKTAHLFKKLIGNNELGVKINLKKRIPIKAGFGGGSSDAAATIKGLEKLWEKKLNDSQKKYLASKLGKDVFYFLKEGLCQVSDDGSLVNKLAYKIPNLYLIIIIPKIKKPSTGWMYNNLNLKSIGRNLKKINVLEKAIIKQDKEEILSSLFNDFEDTVIKLFPIVKEIKNDMIKAGAINTLLAGSGLSMTGFFTEKIKMSSALKN